MTKVALLTKNEVDLEFGVCPPMLNQSENLKVKNILIAFLVFSYVLIFFQLKIAIL